MGVWTSFFASLCVILCFALPQVDCHVEDRRKVYIVYMGSLPTNLNYSSFWHHLSILRGVVANFTAEKAIVQSYHHSFNGFAAKLTEIEKRKIASLDGVVSVFADKKLKLHTTRSWDFMGFSETVQRSSSETNVIIGVLDTGVWPESQSFSDRGFGPIPRKWKGQCPKSKSFPCNKKLIGARNMVAPNSSPRDLNGHGTHTASTAAGSVVRDTSFYDIARGSARGAVPSARIAAYKICNDNGNCLNSDILAGFDIAIKDGVDIISISVGDLGPTRLFEDAIAIGSFHAMQSGILTVQSGGNMGVMGSIVSLAPWLFSVAASATDRHIRSNTILGNGETLTGYAVNSDTMPQKNHSLVYGKDVRASNCSAMDGRYCYGGCLDSNKVKGKIVICAGSKFGVVEAARAGALGTIFTPDISNVAEICAFTASGLEHNDLLKLASYYRKSKSPSGFIHKTETLIHLSAPIVASFSSRGPNKIVPDILKPDITAPGVEILAAFSPMQPPSNYVGDKRSVNYSILSGTSMACPHISGASAYVKSFHPTWSPWAIKSALMTTAWAMSVEKNPGGEFSYGAGHVDPVKAVNPGLVYEAGVKDYTSFLCKQEYNASTIKLITGRRYSCPAPRANSSLFFAPADLNYPSMTAKIPPLSTHLAIKFQRRVTNVGDPVSTYKSRVTTSSPNLQVDVDPRILSFESLYQKKSFDVTVVVVGPLKNGDMNTASLQWFDGTHRVTSPIVIH